MNSIVGLTIQVQVPWLRQDDYRGELTNPRSLMGYQYVVNSPINHKDYYGYLILGGGMLDFYEETLIPGATYISGGIYELANDSLFNAPDIVIDIADKNFNTGTLYDIDSYEFQRGRSDTSKAMTGIGIATTVLGAGITGTGVGGVTISGGICLTSTAGSPTAFVVCPVTVVTATGSGALIGIGALTTGYGSALTYCSSTNNDRLGEALKRTQGGGGGGNYIPKPPKDVTNDLGLTRTKQKGPRATWKDKDGNIYEWDSQHGAFEKYTKKGQHVGEMDTSGNLNTKKTEPTRLILNMTKTEQYFNLYNIALNSKYIVYLDKDKFLRHKDDGRKIISQNEINLNAIDELILSQNSVYLFTDEESFLSLYLEKDMDFPNNPYFKELKKIQGISSSYGLRFANKQDSKVLKSLIMFSIEYLNNLYFITKPDNKTFIFKNSFYLTNIITEKEKQNFSIKEISEKEILNRIKLDFFDMVDSLD